MPCLLTQLRQSTSILHQEVEQYAYSEAIQKRDLNLEQYKDLVRKNYFLHRSLEKQLTAHWAFRPHVSSQQFFIARSSWLKQDLEVLQLQEELIDLLADKVNMKIPSVGLGVMYVLEGSMLGGNIIYKHLQQIPEIRQSDAFHFYRKSAKGIGARWRRFQGILAAEEGERAQRAIVEAACETFRYFIQVYRQKPYVESS